MAWEISITPEGWEEIRTALESWDKTALIDAIMEDNQSKRQDFKRHYRNNPNIKRPARLKRADLDRLYPDTLAEIAFDLVRENNTCDNGGFNYWVDIDGYHKVELGE